MATTETQMVAVKIEPVVAYTWWRPGKNKRLHAKRMVAGIPYPGSMCGTTGTLEKAMTWHEVREPVTSEQCQFCVKAIARASYEPSEVCMRAAKVLSQVYGGLLHVPIIKDYTTWAEVDVYSGVATYDGNQLTELVIAAHEACVKLEIVGSGPRRLKLLFYARNREGNVSHRHPTLEQAVASFHDCRTPDGWYPKDMGDKGYVRAHAMVPARGKP